MSGLKTFLDRVGGSRSVSLWAWLLLSPLAVFGSLSGFDRGILAKNLIELLLFSFLSYLSTGPIFLIAWASYLNPRKARKPRPVSAILTYLIAGLLAGAVLSGLLANSDLTLEPNLQDRILSRTWLGVYWSVAITLVLDASDRYRSSLQSLTSEAERVKALLLARSEYVLAVRKEMVDGVIKTISQALEKNDSKTLNIVADKVIRPLTSFLETTAKKPYLVPQVSGERVSLAPVITSALTKPTQIWLAALIGALYPIVVVVNRFGWLGFANFVGVFLILGLTLLLVRALADGRRLVGLMLMALGALACGVAGSSLEIFFLDQSTFMGTLNLGSWLLTYVALVNFSLEDARRHALEQLKQKLNQSHWAEQRLQQEIWVESRKVAKVVHGTVQSKIRAAAVSKTSLSRSEIEALTEECIRLVQQGPEHQTIYQFVEQSRRLWRGIAQIRLVAEPSVIKATESDPIALTSLLEILRESFTNAIRHGQASKLFVKLALDKDPNKAALIVEVENNGAPIVSERVSGFGFSVLDEVTSKWDLEQLKNRVVLTAELALDPNLG